MDFIERWFGASPDNGNGSLEMAIVVLAILAISTLALWVGLSHK